MAIASSKGGTGKTTTTFNLAYALANIGNRVLMVDMDPQANLTMCAGIARPDTLKYPMGRLLEGIMEGTPLPDTTEYIVQEDGVDIIPCNPDLTVTEINLRNELGGEHTLSELLEPLRAEYDYILIDTAPHIGLLTINALAACDSVIVPVSPQLWSATGLRDLISTVAKIRRKINPRIEIEGILLTMCDERTNLYREVAAMLEEFCGERMRIFPDRIPATVKVGEANYASTSIMKAAPSSKAALAYMALAREVMTDGD